MEWTIEILNDAVRAELEALPADQIARFLRIGDLIQSLETGRGSRAACESSGGALWEIRMKGKDDGISRALYVIARPRRVVVVRVFSKKTQKTPRREIELALKRAEDFR